MSKSEHRNHALYSLIAPNILRIFSEGLEVYGRLWFSKCRLSSDGTYLDIYVDTSASMNGKEVIRDLRNHAGDIQRIIAQAKILSKMPRIRFRTDIQSGKAVSVEDILDDIRAKYDLS